MTSSPPADRSRVRAAWAALAAALCGALVGCSDPGGDLRCAVEAGARLFSASHPAPGDVRDVGASAETPPVPDRCDAADDPAIWVNTADPSASLVIGTNKQRGLEVYDLAGAPVSRLDAGRTNNVDLRADGEDGAIVVASNRTRLTIDVLRLRAAGDLRALYDIPAGFDGEEPYGVCMYRSAAATYAIATYQDGAVRQWDLAGGGAGAPVRTLRVASQAEGCVADDDAGVLFVGEEDVGIWRFGADPGDTAAPVLVDGMFADGGRLAPDVEGLTLYAPPRAPSRGYLIASSQGNDTFVVYDRLPPHAYRGTFRVAGGDIDGVADTDGLAATAAALGAGFPDGLLVVQDGFNRDGAGEANQNFKLVSWREVEAALGLGG